MTSERILAIVEQVLRGPLCDSRRLPEIVRQIRTELERKETIMKFRKKPVVVDAQQWFSDGHCPVWAQDRVVECGDHAEIETLEGTMRAKPGDWIIRGVAGEIYPCKPDIFEATYEPAEQPERTTT